MDSTAVPEMVIYLRQNGKIIQNYTTVRYEPVKPKRFLQLNCMQAIYINPSFPAIYR